MKRPLKNVTPLPARAPRLFRALMTGVAVIVIVVLCLLFPRVLAFVELAARELRYFWWLVLLVALSAYFFFFFGRKKD
jgi:hypothetical protein